MKILLASKSPRRAEILRQVGLEFDVIETNWDESLPEDISGAAAAVMLLSKRKAESAAEIFSNPTEKLSNTAENFSSLQTCKAKSSFDEDIIIIAADTLVTLNGCFLGKPSGVDAAFDMLRRLRDREHSVCTGVTLVSIPKSGGEMNSPAFYTFYEQTTVHMRDYSDEEIAAYIKTKEPFDKAGGYGIQGRGATLVEKINGDYYNVVGLPIAKVCVYLERILKRGE